MVCNPAISLLQKLGQHALCFPGVVRVVAEVVLFRRSGDPSVGRQMSYDARHLRAGHALVIHVGRDGVPNAVCYDVIS